MFGLPSSPRDILSEDIFSWPEESTEDRSEKGIFSDSSDSLNLETLDTSSLDLYDTEPSPEKKLSILADNHFSLRESGTANNQVPLTNIAPPVSSTTTPSPSILCVFNQALSSTQRPEQRPDTQLIDSLDLLSPNPTCLTSANYFSYPPSSSLQNTTNYFPSFHPLLPYSSRVSGQTNVEGLENVNNTTAQQGKKRIREESGSLLSENLNSEQIVQENKKRKITGSFSTATHSTIQPLFKTAQQQIIQQTKASIEEQENELKERRKELIQEINIIVEKLGISKVQVEKEGLNIESLEKIVLLDLIRVHKRLKSRIPNINSKDLKKWRISKIEAFIDAEYVKIRELDLKVSELIGSCKAFLFIHQSMPDSLFIKQKIEILIQDQIKHEDTLIIYQKYKEKLDKTEESKDNYLKELKSKTSALKTRKKNLEEFITLFSKNTISKKI